MPPAASEDFKPDCPFCAIADAYPPSHSILPVPPFSTPPPSQLPATPTAYLLLSTPHIIAFLDHAPISRGHTLVCVRAHREKLSNVRVEEGASVGRWLGLISRAVVGAVKEGEVDGQEQEEDGEGREGPAPSRGNGDGNTSLQEELAADVKEDEGADVGDWNVVQNNGARAAQVVPHVHFHIIPRVGDVPEVKARSWTVFGRGQREDLDEEDAVRLVRRIRRRLGREVERVKRRDGEGMVRGLFAIGGEAEGSWEGRWSKL